jgi:hypothetical protein
VQPTKQRHIVFKSLTRGLVASDLADLRPAQQAKNITLRVAARDEQPSQQDPAHRSGTFPDYDIVKRNRVWLGAA